VQITIEGRDPEAAAKLAGQVRDRVAAMRGAVDVQVVQRLDAPALLLDVDRRKAADIGLTAPDVLAQAMAALNPGSPALRNLWTDSPSGPYRVVVRYPETGEFKLEDVLNLPITGAGQLRGIKLATLVAVRQTREAVEVDHLDLRRVFRVRANVEDRELRDVAADIRQALPGLPVPDGLRLGLEVREPSGTK
jgi:multidrug efflux pump subunit AcrB